MLLAILIHIFASAEVHEVRSHHTIFSHIKEISNKNSNILVVYDIDNTLLKMKTHFGSDQWFQWQKSLLQTQSPHKVSSDFNGLLKVQHYLHYLGTMNLTEDIVVDHIQWLQKKDIQVIALTSRSPYTRSTTEEHLSRFGIDFSVTPIPCPVFDTDRNGRKYSYRNGIMMVSGLHKGEMLRELISCSHLQYSAIVFVDDHLKNVQRVDEGLSPDHTVLSFRYTYLDPIVLNFHSSDKRNSKDGWQRLKHILNEHLGHAF